MRGRRAPSGTLSAQKTRGGVGVSPWGLTGVSPVVGLTGVSPVGAINSQVCSLQQQPNDPPIVHYPIPHN